MGTQYSATEIVSQARRFQPGPVRRPEPEETISRTAVVPINAVLVSRKSVVEA